MQSVEGGYELCRMLIELTGESESKNLSLIDENSKLEDLTKKKKNVSRKRASILEAGPYSWSDSVAEESGQLISAAPQLPSTPFSAKTASSTAFLNSLGL